MDLQVFAGGIGRKLLIRPRESSYLSAAGASFARKAARQISCEKNAAKGASTYLLTEVPERLRAELLMKTSRLGQFFCMFI